MTTRTLQGKYAEKLEKRIDKVIKIFKSKIRNLSIKKENLLNSGFIGPENGYIISDINYEINQLKYYIDILEGKDDRE